VPYDNVHDILEAAHASTTHGNQTSQNRMCPILLQHLPTSPNLA